MNTSALPIIQRMMRFRERSLAIGIVRRLIAQMPVTKADKNPFQWIVWACIASMVIFFTIFIYIC